jgi:hypothetical protein
VRTSISREIKASNKNAAVPDDPETPTVESARHDGEIFGRAVGKRTAQEMTRAGLSSNQLQLAGSEGVEVIIARANSLASAGLDRTIVAAWTEGAAEAFNSELSSAASLLRASTPPGLTH